MTADVPIGTGPRRKPLIVAAVVAAVLCIGAVAAYQVLKSAPDTGQRARERAVRDLRATAAGSRDEVSRVLRTARPGEDPGAVVARARQTVEQSSRYSGTVFGTGVEGDRLRLDVSFVGRGEAGGGLDYESVTLRLCVRMEGTVGGMAVDLGDTPCDPHLPSYDPNLGNITGTAKVSE